MPGSHSQRARSSARAPARPFARPSAAEALDQRRRVVVGLVLAVAVLVAAMQFTPGLWVILPTVGLMVLLVLLVREASLYLRERDAAADVPRRGAS